MSFPRQLGRQITQTADDPTTLETVFAQTFTDFEVLIINDGSSD
ncbi:glycosyltransferase family A protein, partial [Nostoc sp. PCC 7120 = FACHB-418]